MKTNKSFIVPGWKSLLVFGLALAAGEVQAQRPLGVDVSSYQGHPTWSSIRSSGRTFAWAKATEGVSLTDADFTYNMANGKAAGVYMGAYDFTHPASNTPGAEAAYFWAAENPYMTADGLSLSPMLDMEVFTGIVGASSYSDWVNQWCNTIVNNAAAKGVRTKPSIYFSACHGGQFNTSINQWYSDIANYNGQNPQTGTAWSACATQDPWGSSIWHFWQYSSTTAVPGVSGNCDVDVYNGDAASLVSTMVATSTGYPNYGFNSDAQGWSIGNGLTGFAWTGTGWPGIIYADQNANDGFFYGPATGFSGAGNASVNVNVYIQAAAAPHDMQLFWKTTADNAFSASKSSPIVSYTWPGTWARMNLDCNSGLWAGQNVNQLRLDVDNINHGNRFLIDHVVAQTTPRYTFDANPQGWASGNSMSAIAWSGTGWPGIIYADQTGNDCGYVGPAGMNFWGANNDRVHVRIYPQSGTSGGVHDAQLFWNTTADGAFSEAKSSGIITYYGNDQYIDIYFNVGLNTWWNGNNNGGGNGGAVNQLRLDLDSINHGTRWIVDSIQIEHVNYDLPSITTQPTSQSAVVGGTATFSVVGNGGNSALSYQWYKIGNTGATAIAGATASSLVIANAQLTDATNYLVTVFNQASLLNSAVVSLTVTGATPPSITTQPSGLAVIQGQNAPFSVTATGTAPLGYQWTFNAANITGATTSAYTVTAAQPANAGNYAVVVSNGAGSVTSANAVLVVNVPPSVTTQPSSQTVNQGQNAVFNVTAAGTAPLTYQWRINTLSIAGATTASYTRINCQSSDAASYSCQITNVAGSVITANAMLTVNTPPTINTQPVSQLVSVSNTAIFSVSVSGTTPLTYQWNKNGVAISGATLSSLTLPNLTWTSAGSYTVGVTNAVAGVTSAAAVLTVQQAEFTFFDGFENYALGGLDNNQVSGPNANAANPWWGLGTHPELTVYTNRAGVTPHGGSKMVSATTNINLTQEYLNLPYRMNAGHYYYGNFMLDWWFYDPKGTGAGSSNYTDYMAVAQYLPVSLTSDFVTAAFTNYNQRMSLGGYSGAGANIGVYQSRLVAATGGINVNGWFNTATPRSVGWHHGRMVVGIPVNNSGAVQMFIDNLYTPTFSYATSGTNIGFNLIEINNSFGGANTGGYLDDLTFRVANDPWIAQQPVNTTVTAGQTATITTIAIGTAYQWQLNGVNISGATGTTCTVVNAQAANAGTYTCTITGANGTITTTPVVLTVN